MSHPLHLLLVEDSQADRRLLCGLLGQFEHPPQISAVSTVAEALEALGQQTFDCAVLDYRLPDGDALGILDALGSLPTPPPPSLVVTGVEDRAIELQSLLHGAADFMAKHRLTSEKLCAAVTAAIGARLAQQTNPEARLDPLAFGSAEAFPIAGDPEAPLRAALSLERELTDRFPSVATALEDSLTALRRDGLRAHRIGQELQRFARLARDPGKPVALDPREAIDRALVERGESLSDAGVLAIAPLPRVVARQSLLVQLFGALIENSIQCRGPKPLRIQIRADRDGDRVVFGVEDNGIGIPAADCERVFGMFQRLERPETPSGLGVGLALARRIAELHGGEMWAEPVRRGARIRFSLPAAGEAQGEASEVPGASLVGRGFYVWDEDPAAAWAWGSELAGYDDAPVLADRFRGRH